MRKNLALGIFALTLLSCSDGKEKSENTLWNGEKKAPFTTDVASPAGMEPSASDLVSLLKCASSTVDDREFSYHHLLPPLSEEERYSFSGEFKVGEQEKRFQSEYFPNKDQFRTKFYDEKDGFIITQNLSPIFGDGIEYSGNPTREERECYQQFLKQSKVTLARVCEENPFAKEVISVDEYDAILNRTTKPTMVYFKADWCAPCHWFEDRTLRWFIKRNFGQIDLVRVNIGGKQPFSLKEEWEGWLEKKYDINDDGLPLVVFLDQNHRFKGYHIGNDSIGFRIELEKALGYRWK